MRKHLLGFFSILLGFTPHLYCEWVHGHVIQHAECQEFPLGPGGIGGHLKNVSEGARELELWHSHIAPGQATPIHMHDTEEIFVFIKGQGKAIVGDEIFYFSAPCTLILPANTRHQVVNLGREATDHFAILPKRSQITDDEDQPMNLPWRSKPNPSSSAP